MTNNSFRASGRRERRTRWVHTDRYAVAIEVEAVLPDSDPSDWTFESWVVELLREVEAHARAGDVEWLRQHGKVYAAMGVA